MDPQYINELSVVLVSMLFYIFMVRALINKSNRQAREFEQSLREWVALLADPNAFERIGRSMAEGIARGLNAKG